MRKKSSKVRIPSRLWIFFDKLLLEAASPIMVVDSRGHILFINRKHSKVLGFSDSEISEKNWFDDLVPQNMREDLVKFHNEMLRDMICCYRFQSPFLTSKGSEKEMCWTVVPLMVSNKPMFLYIGRVGSCPVGKKREGGRVSPASRRVTYEEIIATLFESSRIHEPDVAEHAIKVTKLAIMLAAEMGLAKGRIDRLEMAAILHDVGKLSLDAKVLYKKERLKKVDFEEVKKHAANGAQMIHPIYFLRDIIPIMESHHENYDGSGYPYGLKGKQIPLEGRILCIADMYEALTADRPYRKALTRRQAMSIMEKEKGRKLDPKLAEVFIEMVEKNKL